MISIDDLKVYLPQYLTEESQKKLFEELKSFPNNMDSRLYTRINKYTETIFQGDGIKDMLMINLPGDKISKTPAMILSNTCDIDAGNVRLITPNMIYAPILNLNKVLAMLKNAGIGEEPLEGLEKSIREQHITQIFYLPKGGMLEADSIVMLDKICSCDNEAVSRDSLKEMRLFSLSQYGLYLFLLKLSIHFTRIREGVDRSCL